MVVYSELLARGVTAGAQYTQVYTAPSVGVVVVRDIILLPSTIGGAAIGVLAQSGSVIAWIYRAAMPAAPLTQQWEGRQVMVPGEVLVVYSDVPATYYRISGYLLGG